ncbi:unnamed protein product, partial [Chrysoparadoxa australica]
LALVQRPANRKRHSIGKGTCKCLELRIRNTWGGTSAVGLDQVAISVYKALFARPVILSAANLSLRASLQDVHPTAAISRHLGSLVEGKKRCEKPWCGRIPDQSSLDLCIKCDELGDPTVTRILLSIWNYGQKNGHREAQPRSKPRPKHGRDV